MLRESHGNLSGSSTQGTRASAAEGSSCSRLSCTAEGARANGSSPQFHRHHWCSFGSADRRRVHLSGAALIKEVRERLHVMKFASREFRSEMTEMAAKSRERIFQSRELLHRLNPGVAIHAASFGHSVPAPPEEGKKATSLPDLKLDVCSWDDVTPVKSREMP
jgi:hypothetical protein